MQPRSQGEFRGHSRGRGRHGAASPGLTRPSAAPLRHGRWKWAGGPLRGPRHRAETRPDCRGLGSPRADAPGLAGRGHAGRAHLCLRIPCVLASAHLRASPRVCSAPSYGLDLTDFLHSLHQQLGLRPCESRWFCHGVLLPERPHGPVHAWAGHTLSRLHLQTARPAGPSASLGLSCVETIQISDGGSREIPSSLPLSAPFLYLLVQFAETFSSVSATLPAPMGGD